MAVVVNVVQTLCWLGFSMHVQIRSILSMQWILATELGNGSATTGALRALKEAKVIMALQLAFLVAGGGIGRVFAEVARGATVAPGTLVGAATEPTVISSSPSHRATNVPTSMNDDD